MKAGTGPNAYTGPECPRCGWYLDLDRLGAGEQRCSGCGGVFLATLFRPPEVRVEVRRLVEAGPEGAVPCARHSGNASVGNCTRCGVFMCALCRIGIEGQELCPGCFDRLNAEGVLGTAQTRLWDFRGLARFLGIAGILVSWPFGLLTGAVTLYCAFQAVRQRRQWNEIGGLPSLVFFCLLGVTQMGLGVAFFVALVSELGGA